MGRLKPVINILERINQNEKKVRVKRMNKNGVEIHELPFGMMVEVDLFSEDWVVLD